MDNKVFTSRNIILNMLEGRGYDISKYRHFSFNELCILKRNNALDMVLENSSGTTCYVQYHISKKFKSTDLRKAVEAHYKNDNNDGELDENDELIIICNEKLLLSKKYCNFISKLENYESKKYYIQIFDISSLLYDLTKHELVPKHIILNEDEKAGVLEHYRITDNKLPRISKFDPVAKFIGLKRGDMCKIIRTSYTAGEEIYYRVCY